MILLLFEFLLWDASFMLKRWWVAYTYRILVSALVPLGLTGFDWVRPGRFGDIT